jgi:hypothetical protein
VQSDSVSGEGSLPGLQADSFSDEGSLPGLQMATFFLYPCMAEEKKKYSFILLFIRH